MRAGLRSAAERERLVAAYRASGLSAKAFAGCEHVPMSTFYQWLAHGRTEPKVRIAKVIRRSATASRPALVGAPPALVIEVDATRVHVPERFDPATLGAVLDVIRARARNAAS